MKNKIKKIMAMLVVIIMALPTMGSFVASATTTTQLFYDSFDIDYVTGNAESNDFKANGNGGLEQVDSYWAYTYNYATDPKSTNHSFYMQMNPHDTLNNYLSYEYKEAGNESDIVMKLNNISGMVDYPAFCKDTVLNNNAILHIGYEFKATDYNSIGTISGNIKAGGTVYFKTDNEGYLYLLGTKTSKKYDINNWCKIDLYYEKLTATWYLYADETFITTSNAGATYAINSINHLYYGVSANTVSSNDVFYMNNICLCIEDKIPELPEVHEFEYMKADFDSLTPDADIGGTFGSIVNGGKEVSDSTGYYFANEVDGLYNNFYVYDKNVGISKIINRGANNNALEITTGSDAAVENQINGGYATFSFEKDNPVMHIGMDVYRYDKSCGLSLGVQNQASSWLWNIVYFKPNGNLTFMYTDNIVLEEYNINTWYNIDVYYSINSGKWYLYIDDKLVDIAKYKISLESVKLIRATWTSPAGQETKLAVDNLFFGEISAEEVFGNLSVKQGGNDVTTTFTTGTITAECDVITAELDNPAIVIAQYKDGELIKLAPSTYTGGKVSASLDVTEADGTVKVIFLDSMTTIKPLGVNVELTAAK